MSNSGKLMLRIPHHIFNGISKFTKRVGRGGGVNRGSSAGKNSDDTTSAEKFFAFEGYRSCARCGGNPGGAPCRKQRSDCDRHSL